MKPSRVSPSLAVVAVVACAIVATSTVAAEPTGSCLTARVPARMVLPDGSLHAAGDLTLCLERHLTPVSEMNRIAVRGATGGVFVGRRTRPEQPVTRPMLVFHRNDNDDWILVGFIRPARDARDGATSVRLTDPDRLRSLVARGLQERPVPAAESGVVLARFGGSTSEPQRTTLLLAAR